MYNQNIELRWFIKKGTQIPLLQFREWYEESDGYNTCGKWESVPIEGEF